MLKKQNKQNSSFYVKYHHLFLCLIKILTIQLYLKILFIMDNSLRYQRQNQRPAPPKTSEPTGQPVQSVQANRTSPHQQMQLKNKAQMPKSKIKLDQKPQNGQPNQPCESQMSNKLGVQQANKFQQNRDQRAQAQIAPQQQQSKSYSPNQHQNYSILNPDQNQDAQMTYLAQGTFQAQHMPPQKRVKLGGGTQQLQAPHHASQNQINNKQLQVNKQPKKVQGVFNNYGGVMSSNSGASAASSAGPQGKQVSGDPAQQRPTSSHQSSSNASKGSQISAKYKVNSKIQKGAYQTGNQQKAQAKSLGSQKSQKSQISQKSGQTQGSQNQNKPNAQSFYDYGMNSREANGQGPAPQSFQYNTNVKNPQFMAQQHPRQPQRAPTDFASNQSPLRNQQPYQNYDRQQLETDSRNIQSSAGKKDQASAKQIQINQISKNFKQMSNSGNQYGTQLQSRNRNPHNHTSFANYTVQSHKLQDTQGLTTLQNFQSPNLSQDNKKAQKQNSEEPRSVVDFIGISASGAGAGTEPVGRCLHKMRNEEGQSDPQTEKENKLRQKKQLLMSDSLNMLTKQRNQYLNQSINNSNNSKERRDNSRQATQKIQPSRGAKANPERRNSQASYTNQNILSFDQNQYQMVIGQVGQKLQIQGSQFSVSSKQYPGDAPSDDKQRAKRGKSNHQVRQSDGVALKLNKALTNQSTSKTGARPSENQLKVQNILIQATGRPQKMVSNCSIGQNRDLMTQGQHRHAPVQSFQTDCDMAEDGGDPGPVLGSLVQSISQNEYNDSMLAQQKQISAAQ